MLKRFVLVQQSPLLRDLFVYNVPFPPRVFKAFVLHFSQKQNRFFSSSFAVHFLKTTTCSQQAKLKSYCCLSNEVSLAIILTKASLLNLRKVASICPVPKPAHFIPFACISFLSLSLFNNESKHTNSIIFMCQPLSQFT